VIEERSIWNAALNDILAVIPLRGVRHGLASMSSDELRQKTLQIARLDDLWNHDIICPVKVARYPLGSGVCRVEVVLGGDFILTLFRDGALQLHRTSNVTELLMTVRRRDGESCTYFPHYTDMRRSSSPRGEHWAVVVDYYRTSEWVVLVCVQAGILMIFW
jgi:hypothetical protein